MRGDDPREQPADRAPTERPSRRVVWAARLGGLLVRALGATWRYRVTSDEAVKRFRADGTPIVFALWHGQLLPLLYHHRGQGVTVLISEHADGEIIARIATALGYRTVRGSTSRGASRALIGLTRVIRDRGDLAVTPDGPRGPAKSFAPRGCDCRGTNRRTGDCRCRARTAYLAAEKLGSVSGSATIYKGARGV